MVCMWLCSTINANSTWIIYVSYPCFVCSAIGGGRKWVGHSLWNKHFCFGLKLWTSLEKRLHVSGFFLNIGVLRSFSLYIEICLLPAYGLSWENLRLYTEVCIVFLDTVWYTGDTFGSSLCDPALLWFFLKWEFWIHLSHFHLPLHFNFFSLYFQS